MRRHRVPRPGVRGVAVMAGPWVLARGYVALGVAGPAIMWDLVVGPRAIMWGRALHRAARRRARGPRVRRMRLGRVPEDVPHVGRFKLFHARYGPKYPNAPIARPSASHSHTGALSDSPMCAWDAGTAKRPRSTGGAVRRVRLSPRPPAAPPHPQHGDHPDDRAEDHERERADDEHAQYDAHDIAVHVTSPSQRGCSKAGRRRR